MTTLSDVTLAAIVRDELVNPAGGIADFIDHIVPFVEGAVIVDTGSVDGTRDMLSDAQKKYESLTVVDHPFDGYGPSRNVSLSHVKTSFVLVLDADERLPARSRVIIANDLYAYDGNNDFYYDRFSFDFHHINPMGRRVHAPTMRCRLFRQGTSTYEGVAFEQHRVTAKRWCGSRAVIKHFVPDQNVRRAKSSFYTRCQRTEQIHPLPRTLRHSASWKQPGLLVKACMLLQGRRIPQYL